VEVVWWRACSRSSVMAKKRLLADSDGGLCAISEWRCACGKKSVCACESYTALMFDSPSCGLSAYRRARVMSRVPDVAVEGESESESMR
jgi:hypothetical protein